MSMFTVRFPCFYVVDFIARHVQFPLACPLGWGLEVCGPGDANQQHILFIWGEFVLGTRSRMCYKLQFSACLSRIHPGALVQVQFFFIYVPFIFYYRATAATNIITDG